MIKYARALRDRAEKNNLTVFVLRVVLFVENDNILCCCFLICKRKLRINIVRTAYGLKKITLNIAYQKQGRGVAPSALVMTKGLSFRVCI